MSPLIMYMTSSLGSLWNSLRNSRPRATNAMLSGACHRTVLGRPEARMLLMTCPRSIAFISSIGLLLRRVLDAQVESAGMEPEALHARARGDHLHLVVDEDHRRVLHDQALGLLVEISALTAVGDLTGLDEQLIDLGVVVVRPVRE